MPSQAIRSARAVMTWTRCASVLLLLPALVPVHAAAQAIDQIDQLSLLPGVEIVPLDVYQLLHAIVADPAGFGLTDVTSACVTPGVSPFACAKPDEYLFWDGIHPTRRGHAIVADAAVDALGR